MSGRLIHSLNENLSRVFPERRIYIRSDARTRYLTFSPASQCGAAIIAAVLIGWSTYTSIAYIDKATDGRTAENRLQAAQEAYEIKLSALQAQQRTLEEELNRSNRRGDIVTDKLSANQQQLVEKAGALRDSQAELVGLRNSIEALMAERRVERDEIEALHEEVTGLRIAIAEARRTKAELAGTLEGFSVTMNDVIAARDTARTRAADLDDRVSMMQTEIAHLEAQQESILAELESATRTSLASLGEIFVGTDVDLDAILNSTRRDFTGRGGGPVDDDGERSDLAPQNAETEERVAALSTDMERMSLMRVAIDRLPFGMPTSGARMTSGFGPRRDPYRRSSRMHNGIDFAAPVGTPIMATGEGVVTFSGRQSGYGIVVKIRHAFGFETVYAHLSKSRVTVGQRVTRGDRIADMGSTGRSTGSHLHYEVRIDGQPVNPRKFIKAARDVL